MRKFTLDEAKAYLDSSTRESLEDHAFGDAEVYWYLLDTAIAYGYFGKDSEVTVESTLFREATQFKGAEADALRRCGISGKTARNDNVSAGDKPSKGWEFLQSGMTLEHLGFLPLVLLPDDPRPAKDQIEDRYAHGGGWYPFEGFRLLDNGCIQYPDDPPFKPLAKLSLANGETATFYEHEWLMLTEPDGSWEMQRMD